MDREVRKYIRKWITTKRSVRADTHPEVVTASAHSTAILTQSIEKSNVLVLQESRMDSDSMVAAVIVITTIVVTVARVASVTPRISAHNIITVPRVRPTITVMTADPQSVSMARDVREDIAARAVALTTVITAVHIAPSIVQAMVSVETEALHTILMQNTATRSVLSTARRQ